MQISDVKAFLEVVKYKSFSAAARKRYISQATVSMRVKSLESESGIPERYFLDAKLFRYFQEYSAHIRVIHGRRAGL